MFVWTFEGVMQAIGLILFFVFWLTIFGLIALERMQRRWRGWRARVRERKAAKQAS